MLIVMMTVTPMTMMMRLHSLHTVSCLCIYIYTHTHHGIIHVYESTYIFVYLGNALVSPKHNFWFVKC